MRFGIFIILAILLIVGLFYILSPKSQQSPNPQQKNISPTISPVPTDTSEKAFSLVIKNGEVVSENKVISVDEGDSVLLTITNDSDDEIHIHGYDEVIPLTKDTPAQYTLKATISGRFPIELHGSGIEVAALEVQPK